MDSPVNNGKNIENESFKSLISEDERKKLEEIYKRTKKNDEYEFMFYNYKEKKMRFMNFLQILEYIKHRSKKNNLNFISIITLDIIYSERETKENYRITISGIESINKYMEMLHIRKNHVIFNVLAKMGKTNPDINIIKKRRDVDNVLDINEFDIRARLSEEKELTESELKKITNLDESHMNNITFRYKQRASLNLLEDNEILMRLELTTVKSNKNINYLETDNPIYELEVDITAKKNNPNKKYLDILCNETTRILKILQQSNNIINKNISQNVLNRYADLLGVNKEKMINLDGRKAQSLEVQHVIDKLPNKYAVTDKADGERYFLIIHEQSVYLISYNLEVKNTGIKLPDKKYNDTILDGEYIFLSDKNKYIFMVFDCLYSKGKDIRDVSNFMSRLQVADDVINNCFVNKKDKGYIFKDYKDKYDATKVVNYHEKEIETYMGALNHDINLENNKLLVRRKYFIAVLGIQDNEIFKYSQLMWNKYVFDKKTACPYVLDGLIYHPLEQKYITSVKESKLFEYKWKPANKNSIDFYIKFARTTDTNRLLTLYDNSRTETIKNKPYRIAHLYVGKMVRGSEKPVLFQPEDDMNKYVAHLFLENGQVRDIEGNLIQDDTVVEFYYDNDLDIPSTHRWVALRTRHDKTESVKRFGKKYGNYFDIAKRVWRSIKNPFTMNDIGILAKDSTMSKHIDVLRKKIDASTILSESKENVYYQIKTNLAKPLRNFHNWMKSVIIYTHCNPTYEHGRNLSILDIACGRGGDLMKFYHSKIDFYVGIDVDNNGLISPTDSAISRYNKFKKSHPKFPKMYFINADGGALLNYEDQSKAIGTMSSQNKMLLEKFFPIDKNKMTKFDRLNCQFAIHYFLKDDIIWNNFATNVNNALKPGGYLLVTCFDADRIIELLKNKTNYASYYTNTKGEKKVLIEIVKKFDDTQKDYKTGNAIDVYNAMISQEGVYNTEYLVSKTFLENEFMEKCNMELVETDLFDNQFAIHKNYFKYVINFEENVKTRKFLQNAAEYYDESNEVNKASYEVSRLNRYYIFRKKDSDKILKGMVGGSVMTNDHSLTEYQDLLDSKKFIKREISGTDDYTFLASIHNVLTESKIVPSSVGIMDFYNDAKIYMYQDNELDEKKINDINKKLIISHEISNDLDSENSTSPVLAINGINLIILENDCDGYANVECHSLTNSKRKRFNRKLPSIILAKNNSSYNPIYKIIDSKLVGLYDSRTKLIKRLVDIADS